MNLRIRLSLSALLMTISIVPALMAQGTSGKPKYSDIENIGKRDINKGQTNFTSMEGETRLGQQAAAELERNVTLVDDADIQGYVDRIAQNIAKNSDAKFPITIKVIQSNDVNASALPGGFIYINTGTIKAADNEAELAFVIAHLVGHVAARHATENNTKGTLQQIGTIPAITRTGGVLGTAIQEQSQIGLPAAMFNFSRAAVKEADFLGLEYLYKAGYDPQAAVRFLRKLEAMEASRPKQSLMFSTHPPAADRIALTETNIKLVLPARANDTINTAEFDAIKARVK
jgi:predicted Zn-dependent protease